MYDLPGQAILSMAETSELYGLNQAIAAAINSQLSAAMESGTGLLYNQLHHDDFDDFPLNLCIRDRNANNSVKTTLVADEDNTTAATATKYHPSFQLGNDAATAGLNSVISKRTTKNLAGKLFNNVNSLFACTALAKDNENEINRINRMEHWSDNKPSFSSKTDIARNNFNLLLEQSYTRRLLAESIIVNEIQLTNGNEIFINGGTSDKYLNGIYRIAEKQSNSVDRCLKPMTTPGLSRRRTYRKGAVATSLATQPVKKRKRRTSFTPKALELLNGHFEMNTHPTGDDITRLAQQIGYDREVVRIWFCNKRQTIRNADTSFMIIELISAVQQDHLEFIFMQTDAKSSNNICNRCLLVYSVKKWLTIARVLMCSSAIIAFISINKIRIYDGRNYQQRLN